MRCWKDAGGAHGQARISGRDSSESSSFSVTHILPHQLLPLCLPLQDKVTSARSGRTFRCCSWSYVLSLLPNTLLAVGRGKRVARVLGLLEIEETREQKGQEEPLLAEVMKKDGEGSAKKMYSVSQADYQLLEEVGLGGTATVYRALYIPRNEIVAVKCLDLHRSNLDDLRREAQMMCLVDHPNVVKGYCSFVVEHSLWEVMPFMAEGSCLHLMKIAYPEGFEEHVIGSLLKETLKAIEYLHRHGHIHRDVKAGNILLDSSGAVKLADFGATAYMFDKGDRLQSRNSFVGTPCWMAPEVLRPGGGYDFKADIWSFGITALELAHGHAPFSKYPPMKVLLMTLQSSPPGLDYDRDKKFSKSFKEIVAKCLVKDPTKRPTAEELLKHSFFKNAKPLELYVESLLSDLPPLWDRVKALKLKDAAQLALKNMPSSNQEALLQSEYQRGVSAWNFDIEDLKAQASLIQDDDELFVAKKDDGKFSHFIKDKEPSILRPNSGNPSIVDETTYRTGGNSQLPNEIPRNGAQNSPYSNSLSAPIQFLGCGNSPEDNGSANVIQRKGRFFVTSENVDLLQVKTGTTEREHLLVEILQLQTRMVVLANELTAERLKCTELQQKLSALDSQEQQREEPEQKGLIYASIESKVYLSTKQP